MIKNEAVLLKNEDEEEEIKPILLNYKKQNIACRIIKRSIDIIAGLVGIILLIPITIIVWFVRIAKKENNGPMFFEQLRIGKDGKLFRMYKFRSMCMNADETLKKYLEENEDARKEYKKYKKLKRDPRITKVGNFIRKTSLDEFPQFINVLKGDMSLVGPRPYLIREKKDIGEAYWQIVKCRPGLTGIWQVRGRSDVTFDERVDMDLEYFYTQSPSLDAKIIVKTVKKVVLKDGAL